MPSRVGVRYMFTYLPEQTCLWEYVIYGASGPPVVYLTTSKEIYCDSNYGIRLWQIIQYYYCIID